MININDFRYHLPEDRIATHPLTKRDESKLLIYRSGTLTHETFKNMQDFLPDNAFLFFNDTKVIPARIHFKKDTGADIEIFLLSPRAPSPIVSVAMASVGETEWQCTIGNLKRWKDGTTLEKELGSFKLTALLTDREKGTVKFSWNATLTFAEIVSRAGAVPLPPYLKRNVEETDKDRYQTIYSLHAGAVAAPTAGLHFTENVFASLKEKKIGHDFLTLHVSAGTFQPVKVEDANQHVMHQEQIIVTRKNLENLLMQNKFIIPVGTTSMRTLESIYWYGVKLMRDASAKFEILQTDPYEMHGTLPTATEALNAVMQMFDDQNLEAIGGNTAIYIKPGYEFKICKGLITNFHQPGSTLILLIAALVGDDWKKIYESALENNYRFLSFGDSSLLLPGGY